MQRQPVVIAMACNSGLMARQCCHCAA